jgi:radical SAM protein with 4Fe4S-binding SPASM domain
MTFDVDFEARALPKNFILELTRRCNNSCMYCYTVWGASRIDYGEQRNGEMSTMDVKNVIDKLQDEVSPKMIGLSGGEPLLREDVPELLAFIRDRGIAPILITNGALLNKEKAQSIALIKSACEITLLSFRKEVHDYLAGRRGARDVAIAGITNLIMAGISPVAVFVATKLNYMDLYRTAELAIALGATALSYNRLNLGAHNLQFANHLLPTPAMIRENLDMLEDLGEKYGIPIAISVVIEPCVIDIRKYQHINFGWCPLAGEDSYFAIDPVGNVRICNHSPTILGNIRKENFLDIYYKHPYVRAFRETLPEECINCDPMIKSVCKGGCKAASEQCYGNLKHVDPFVTMSIEANNQES